MDALLRRHEAAHRSAIWAAGEAETVSTCTLQRRQAVSFNLAGGLWQRSAAHKRGQGSTSTSMRLTYLKGYTYVQIMCRGCSLPMASSLVHSGA